MNNSPGFEVTLSTDETMVHIGKEIRKRLRTIGISNAEFARQMNRSPQAVQWWLDKETIDTGILVQVSEVLEFNFFLLYLQHDDIVKVQEESPIYQAAQKNKEQLDNLMEKLKDCEKERDYLKEINDLLKKGKG